MATAEELLKKAENRKKKDKKKFQPTKRRAWDYVNDEEPSSEKQHRNNQEHISEQYGNEYRNNQEHISEQYGNEYRNNQEHISEQYGNEYRNNQEHISEQYGNEYRNNQEHISEQYGNEYRNNQEHISEQYGNEYRGINKNINRNNNSSKVSKISKRDNNDIKSFSHEDIDTNILKNLRKTIGHQRTIMMLITSHIKSMKNDNNLINIPISILATKINTDKETVRTSIKRLQKKAILLKAQGERGRHGSTQVIVPNFVKKECLKLYNCHPQPIDETNQNGNEYSNEYRNKNRNEKSLYNSSSNNINTITINKDSGLPENWLNINFAPLEEIGFSSTQLKQLHSRSLNTPEIIQDSIYHFAFALKFKKTAQKYSEPLNVLMGVLRKGEAWTEQNYRSAQEIAQEEFIERKKIEKERLNKLKEETYKLAFDEWRSSLTLEEIDKIAPRKKINGDITPQQVKLNNHFKENVWEEIKKEYLLS
ncbi:hypothetical protein Psal006b_03598 (plasmid) [Piscirickettsia salmonis]|uniref:Uncharacterized protein n=1 Tax=Piscirickettsia salmonis TaxID=1238 RepID=A0A1L6THN1_PISSA|nr:hypothetical protein [Piscirickettsia salmonis]AKP75046.1 hypothetical protein PSLF89_3p22 [Piscirickettsia salmonis LF-89 = ATCC VR-1361]ALB24449.1 hypothetical protein KU39_2p46 [Piscirickettsia salmonis]ALY04632.1 hypothetical protein AWE47_17135 [Piscirickettsia salmonis]AOS36997.1 hypothetical protein AVM72_16635 [Piscirickettsia salmonis]APS62260.1 hypothetical protein AVI53_17050 [Piscirickettsia salmonis]